MSVDQAGLPDRVGEWAPFPVGQLDELNARADLLNMLINVGAAKKSVGSKLARDHKGLANSV